MRCARCGEKDAQYQIRKEISCRTCLSEEEVKIFEEAQAQNHDGLEELTHSALNTIRRCSRAYDYRYNRRLQKAGGLQALRMGSAIHKGLDLWRTGTAMPNVIDMIGEEYSGEEDIYEVAIVVTLLDQYAAYWEAKDNFPVDHVELEFRVPLINPRTNHKSRTFCLAGKVDGVAGRHLVETKTCSEDIGPDADYWKWLRIDPQISLYLIALRRLGHDIESTIYDVVRKPSIRPKKVPTLDEDGIKIVYEADGSRAYKKDGSPRLTGGEGLTVASHVETPEEFALRLRDDIADRPEWYFARKEIPILDDYLDTYEQDLWAMAQGLREARKQDHWPRTADRFTCGFCEYANICLSEKRLAEGDVPEGYELKSRKNAELKEVT